MVIRSYVFVYFHNRCDNNRIKTTPYEIFTDTKSNISNMHLFESICYAYIQNLKILDDRSEKGIFVGYDMYSPAY